MAKYKTIRVYPDGNVWVVKKDSAAKASAIKNTKDEALRAARSFAVNQGLTIIIHGKDGRIQRTVTPQEAESNDNCFITTACVKYFKLKDDCYELQTLRKFRDEYLLKSSKDKVLVNQYYTIAPQIVHLLEKDKQKQMLFQEIFKRISEACRAIEGKDFQSAKTIYSQTVFRLMKYFKMI